MTLEDFKKAILFKNQNLSNTPMPQVIAQLNAYMNTHNADAPVEAGALSFYLLNQAFGLMTINMDSKSELPPEAEKLAKLYLNTASDSSARLFYYILLIITREARHLHSSDSFYSKLEKKYGSEVIAFHKHLKGKGSDSAAKALRNGSTYLANTTLGTYAACITEIFNEGQFSGGYGGKPWGNIAETIRKTVHGETSLEIMNDTAWTLAHNNGPMFNKGMLYKGYNAIIYKILDVQRAGMIPQLIASNTLSSEYVTIDVKNAFSLFTTVFPNEASGYVDWFKVEALGSLHKYSNEKKEQQAKYGKSIEATVIEQKENNKFWVNESEFAIIQKYKRAA